MLKGSRGAGKNKNGGCGALWRRADGKGEGKSEGRRSLMLRDMDEDVGGGKRMKSGFLTDGCVG